MPLRSRTFSTPLFGRSIFCRGLMDQKSGFKRPSKTCPNNHPLTKTPFSLQSIYYITLCYIKLDHYVTIFQLFFFFFFLFFFSAIHTCFMKSDRTVSLPLSIQKERKKERKNERLFRFFPRMCLFCFSPPLIDCTSVTKQNAITQREGGDLKLSVPFCFCASLKVTNGFNYFLMRLFCNLLFGIGAELSTAN